MADKSTAKLEDLINLCLQWIEYFVFIFHTIIGSRVVYVLRPRRQTEFCVWDFSIQIFGLIAFVYRKFSLDNSHFSDRQLNKLSRAEPKFLCGSVFMKMININFVFYSLYLNSKNEFTGCGTSRKQTKMWTNNKSRMFCSFHFWCGPACGRCYFWTFILS